MSPHPHTPRVPDPTLDAVLTQLGLESLLALDAATNPSVAVRRARAAIFLEDALRITAARGMAVAEPDESLCLAVRMLAERDRSSSRFLTQAAILEATSAHIAAYEGDGEAVARSIIAISQQIRRISFSVGDVA